MRNPKVWVVLGATNDLDHAAVRYLVGKQKTVIAWVINEDEIPSFFEEVPANLFLSRLGFPGGHSSNCSCTLFLEDHSGCWGL